MRNEKVIVGWVMWVTLLAGGCADASKALQPGFSDAEVKWGEPLAGLQAGIAKRNYQAGREPAGQSLKTVYYSFWVRNVSKQVIKFVWPGPAQFGAPEFPLAGDESVKVVAEYSGMDPKLKGRLNRSMTIKPSKKPGIAQLEPGDVRTFEFRLTPKSFELEQFKEQGYISASYENWQQSIDYGEGNGGVSTGLWGGKVRSGEMALEGGK